MILFMEENYRLAIGKKIAAVRQSRNIPRAELAKNIGTSEPTIKRYEDGEVSKIDVVKLYHIAKELDIDINVLLNKMPIDTYYGEKMAIVENLDVYAGAKIKNNRIIPYADIDLIRNPYFSEDNPTHATHGAVVIKKEDLIPFSNSFFSVPEIDFYAIFEQSPFYSSDDIVAVVFSKGDLYRAKKLLTFEDLVIFRDIYETDNSETIVFKKNEEHTKFHILGRIIGFTTSRVDNIFDRITQTE